MISQRPCRIVRPARGGGDVAVLYFFGADEARAITMGPGAMLTVSASLFLTAPSPPLPTTPIIRTLHRSSPSSPHVARGGADPVDLATGSYVLQRQDVAIPTRGLPLEFTRTYHSAAAAIQGPLGFGWTHSYNMFIFLDATGDLVVRMPDGRLDRYVDDCSGTFEPPPGIYNSLVLNSDGTFTLRTKDRDAYAFDASGRLVALRDRNSNATMLRYAGSRLTSVVLPDGRLLTLSYNAAGDIVVVRDPLGRVTSYAYDSSGNLVTVTDALGRVTRFGYDAEHRITSLMDPRGNTIIRNTYDDDGRVVQQLDAAGSVTTLAYEEGETLETDGLARIRRYRFDSELRISSIVGPLGDAVAYEYDSNSNLTSFTDELGNVTRFSYDDRGNVTAILDPLGHAQNFAYDGADNLVAATDPLGNTTLFAYDAAGNLTRVTDPLGGVTNFAYDRFGQIVSVTDANGGRTSFIYDNRGNISAVVDALGKVTRLAYDAAGRLIRVRDPLRHATSFSYDALNRLVAVQEPLRHVSRFTYDANSNLTFATDAKGVVTSYTYDALNRLTRVEDGQGGMLAYSYDAVGNLTSFTDANSHITRYTYDARDQLTQVADPLDGIARYDYDAAGRLIGVRDPLGHATSFSYDALNRLVGVRDALSNVSRFAYDANSNVISAINANGVGTLYEYDPLNRLTRVVDGQGGTLAYSYDAVGNLTSFTDANGHITRYTYDARDQLIQVADPLGGTARYDYDAAGRLIGVRDPLGHATSFSYDALNRPIAVKDPLGHKSRFRFDANSNLTSATDAKGIRTSYKYDALNRLTQVVDGKRGTLAYSYDAVGNLTSFTDANSHITRYTYDARDQLIQVADPLGRTTSYDYDAAGNLVTRTDARGHITQYTYDALSQVVRTAYANGTSVEHTYDALGNISSMTDSTGTTLFSYDDLSRLLSAIDPLGRRVSYAWDLSGNRTSMTYPDGSIVRYTYDANNRLISVTDWIGNETLYTYDLAGRLLRTMHGNGVVVTNTLDAADRLLGVTNQRSADSNVLANTRYELDAVGNRRSRTDELGRVTRYTYDRLHRLMRVQPKGPLGLEPGDIEAPKIYQYDAAGNRVHLTQGDKVITYTYDEADQLVTAGGLAFGFDANGNQTGCGDDLLVYDEENRLVTSEVGLGGRSCLQLAKELGLSANDEVGSVSNYEYNGLGLRVAQSVTRFDGSSPSTRETTYVWDLGTALPAVIDDGENRYVYGLDLIASVAQENQVQTYLYDGLGSVVAVADTDGNGVTSLTYDAFGARVGGQAAPGGFGFIGQQIDTTGFAYLRARYYDPVTGRFLTTDPLPDLLLSTNFYFYALNNPVTLFDLDGAKPAPAGRGGFTQTAAAAAKFVGKSLLNAVSPIGPIVSGVRAGQALAQNPAVRAGAQTLARNAPTILRTVAGGPAGLLGQASIAGARAGVQGFVRNAAAVESVTNRALAPLRTSGQVLAISRAFDIRAATELGKALKVGSGVNTLGSLVNSALYVGARNVQGRPLNPQEARRFAIEAGFAGLGVLFPETAAIRAAWELPYALGTYLANLPPTNPIGRLVGPGGALANFFTRVFTPQPGPRFAPGVPIFQPGLCPFCPPRIFPGSVPLMPPVETIRREGRTSFNPGQRLSETVSGLTSRASRGGGFGK